MTGLFEGVTPESAIAWGRWLGLQWWAPLALVAVYTPASFVMFPRWAITLAAVAAFGPWAAFALAEAGVLLAAVLGFLAGRALDSRLATGPRIEKISALLGRGGIPAITVIRMLPLAPFMVVNAAMGALRVRLHHFVAGTFLGMLPGMLAATVLGDQLLAALADPGTVNAGAIAAGGLLLAVAVLAGRQLLLRLKPE